MLHAARSLFGGPKYLQRWRATDNGLEGVAAASNDALLIRDELAQVDPRRAGEIAYMLANGSGKHRANRTGGVRAASSWRLLFLSSGEIGLADHMNEAGKRVRAGQEIRLLDLPADAGKGYGAFEDLHGYESGAALSKVLMQATSGQYGTPILAFIEAVIGNRDKLPGIIRELRQDFLSEHLPRDASGQTHRAAGRFALCAVAGELGTKFGITGWQPGEAATAAARCFRDWLDRRGGAGDQERAAMLSQVRAFFEAHGESRFTPWQCEKCGGSGSVEYADGNVYDCKSCGGTGHPITKTIHRAGFRRPNDTDGCWDYLVWPETFRNELCAGFDYRVVIKLLMAQGYLKPSSEGKGLTNHRIPGEGQRKLYHFIRVAN